MLLLMPWEHWFFFLKQTFLSTFYLCKKIMFPNKKSGFWSPNPCLGIRYLCYQLEVSIHDTSSLHVSKIRLSFPHYFNSHLPGMVIYLSVTVSIYQVYWDYQHISNGSTFSRDVKSLKILCFHFNNLKKIFWINHW